MFFNDDITPSASRFGESIKMLFRWKGSIYRLIWEPFLMYLIAYISLSLVYDFILTPTGQRNFEAIARYCSRYTASLPIVLLLGFFTSTTMQRWFSLVDKMPGTAKVSTVFVFSLKDNIPNGEKIVEQYLRWILLSWALTFRMICRPFRKIYPDLASLQNAGLLLEHERLHLEKEEMVNNGFHLPLVVLNWNLVFLRWCNRQEYFNLHGDCNRNIDSLLLFKKNCGFTLKFAGKNIPLAIIQITSITVYSIGVASLMARHLSENKNPATSVISEYIPVLNTFQYFLYFSWLKFGAVASNPFGEDDDDIDVNQLLQSHIEDAARLQTVYTTGVIDEIIAVSLQNNSSNDCETINETINEESLVDHQNNVTCIYINEIEIA